MSFDYFITEQELNKILLESEQSLLNAEKIKFQATKKWRDKIIPDFPGVYALYESKDTLLYIGESGNLRERMSDICRTVNHTFRRQLGHLRFGAIKTNRKFDEHIESLLDTYFDEKLHVAFIKVNFGRIEIEEYLVTKYQKILMNSEKKRKFKLKLDEL